MAPDLHRRRDSVSEPKLHDFQCAGERDAHFRGQQRPVLPPLEADDVGGRVWAAGLDGEAHWSRQKLDADRLHENLSPLCRRLFGLWGMRE